MAWNTKYYTEFMSPDGDLIRLNLQEEDFAGTITELQSGAEPVNVVSDDGDYLTPVVGTGLDIKLISATPLQLVGLNTVSKFAIKVILLKNNTQIWAGWLNPEEYEEVYSEYENYEVSFTANDGIALLRDIKFLNDDGSRIVGIYSAFEVFYKVLAKAQLTGIYIHIADSIKLYDKSNTELTHTATETFLHTIMINADNYIDEKNEAISCRDVLDGLFLSLGLMFRNNVISLTSLSNISSGFSIYDSNVVASGVDITFKKFNDAMVYVGVWDLLTTSFKYDLQNDLEYTDTGSSLTYDTTVREQEVTLSNYTLVNILNKDLHEDDIGSLSVTAERSTSSCPSNERWSEKIYSSADGITVDDTYTYIAQEMQGVEGVTPTTDSKQYYIAKKYEVSGSQTESLFTTDTETNIFFKGFDDSYSDYSELGILVNFDLMLAADGCRDGSTSDVEGFYIMCKITVGTQDFFMNARFGHLEGVLRYERVPLNTYVQPETDYTNSLDTRKGILYHFFRDTNNVVVPGEIKFSVTKEHTLDVSDISRTVRLRFKNFSVKVVKTNYQNHTYTDFTDAIDIVETGTINSDSTVSETDINLIHGTNSSGGIDKAQFMYEHPTVADTYFNINSISKIGAVSTLMTVEKWILSKVFSNKEIPAVKLNNIVVDASTVQHAVFGRITDVAQFPNKIFMISGYNYKPYSNEIIYSLQEINNDNYTL